MPDESSTDSWPRLVRAEDLMLWSGQLIDRLAGVGVKAGSIVPGNITVDGNLTTKGTVVSGIPPNGYVALNPGDFFRPGFLSIHTGDSVRRGYVGYKAVSSHLHLAAETGWGWEMTIPDGDDGLKISAPTMPSIFLNTPGRAGIWFGNTANTGRWFFGHIATGGAGAGLRMYNASTSYADVFQFRFDGDLWAGRFFNGVAPFTWMGGPVQPTANGTVQVQFPNTIVDLAGMAQPVYSQIVAPANSVVLLGASMTITGGAQTMYIGQWSGSAWLNRSGQSAPPGLGTHLHAFAVCDTRWGTQFAVLVSDSKVASITANDAGPWFWGVMLGRTG